MDEQNVEWTHNRASLSQKWRDLLIPATLGINPAETLFREIAWMVCFCSFEACNRGGKSTEAEVSDRSPGATGRRPREFLFGVLRF
jgi:hypothetical protein